MARKNVTTTQIPGGQPQADTSGQPDAAQGDGEQAPGQDTRIESAKSGAGEPVETVAVPKDKLDALLAQVEALSAKVQRLESPTTKGFKPAVNLPDQDDIDLATLKNPVLTKQGWMVPDDYGSNKNVKAG